MSLLVETIRIENGLPLNLGYHNRRMTAALYDLFRIKRSVDLGDIIKVPSLFVDKILKCRVIYGKEIEGVEYIPYSFRKVNRLKLIQDDVIEYNYKYTDRSAIEKLFNRRGECDDILIVKNGFITDTSYSNIIFRKASGEWITPSSYLLRGTRRESLLDAGFISEERVTADNIPGYIEARLINAMLGPEDTDVIPVENIIW